MHLFLFELQNKRGKDREREREKEGEEVRDRQKSYICWFTLQMPTKAKARPSQIQKSEIQSVTPMYVGGIQVQEPSFTFLQCTHWQNVGTGGRART